MAKAETVPWFNSFETNPEGIPITNDSQFGSWTGTEDMEATVTNIGDYKLQGLIQSPVMNYPLDTADHTKVVVFKGGGLTNEVVGVDGENAWVDMMIQPVQMDQPPLSAAISNSQMSMFVNTSGYVCIYHAILTNDTTSSFTTPDGYGWTELNDFGPIGTDKWIRVTVRTDYNRYLSGWAFFQLTVNNHVFSNAAAFVDAGDWQGGIDTYTNANLNGSWFMCAKDGGFRINGVAFSGTGMLDDLVVTNGAVDIHEASTALTITTMANAGGSISPAGVIDLGTAPGETNFTITANPYFHIADIRTNNVTIAGLTGLETVTNLLISGVTAPMTLAVYFAADLASPNSTPQWWLAQYTNSSYPELVLTGDDSDADGDGAREWQEYVAGTIPIDSNSVLKIVGAQVANGTGTVVWTSTTSMPDTNAVKYVVQMATNLLDGTWLTLPGSKARVDGTLSNSAPAVVAPAFFRVSFTNQ
jgi:hypothetical protein